MDPWGTSPMTVDQFASYRADTSARATERLGKGVADFVDQNAGWIALGVAAVGVATLAVSGPIGWGILTGMAISGGMELGSQWLSGKSIDWKKVAKSASIGGIAGGFGAGVAGVVTKVGSKVFGSAVNGILGRASQIGARADEAASWGTRFGNNLAGRYRASQAAWNNVATRLSGTPGRIGQVAQKVGLGGAKDVVEAYAEAGMDTSLTYITDGHHVTAEGLAQSWGVPAVANALIPKPMAKGLDKGMQKLGWDSTQRFLAGARKELSEGIGNFTNGFVTYSGAPMTYSAQYESYQDADYDGPGWKLEDARTEGIKEMFKARTSDSKPVDALKAVSFGSAPAGAGLDTVGIIRDTTLLSTGASGVTASVGAMYSNEVDQDGK